MATKTNYPVGDFLIRIKNALMAGKKQFSVPSTKMIHEIAKCLKREGFLREVSKGDEGLDIAIAYHKKEPILMNIMLVSKPGLRIYKTAEEIENKKGASIYILTTSKGVLSSKEALKKGVGGEVVAEVM